MALKMDLSGIDPGDRILVAVSGGPDSVALLYLLHVLRKKMPLYLHIAHLDHQLRAESKKDFILVREIAAALRIPLSTTRVDVKAYAKKHKLSLEDAGRKLRYDFFFNVAIQMNISKIATAHTQDDQAETILMRLIKGTGLKGLCGIPPAREQGRFTVIRPLLHASKKELLGFLKKNRLRFNLDKTNLEPIYLRNKIRLKILPRLEQINPCVKETISRMAENLRDDFDFLARETDKYYKRCAKKGQNGISISLKIRKLHPSLRKGIIRRAISELKGNLQKIDYKHWQSIDGLLHEKSSGKLVCIPGAICVERQYNFIVFRKKTRKTEGISRQPVNFPGIASITGLKIKGEFLKTAPRDLKTHNKWSEYLDADKLSDKLFIRQRQPGDRFWPLGIAKPLKLKDFLINCHVPRSERDSLFLLCSGKDIAWVVGVRIADKYKITPQTKHILRVTVSSAT